ncbi:peptide chain release factor N(5)-glutamine methyltransferase, partial [Acinetobacter baumannii]
IQNGEPLAYVTGSQPFWTLDLKVTSDTLVPRPDTEVLVETVLNLNLPKNANIVDLGTGTGAIALALASERPDWF